MSTNNKEMRRFALVIALVTAISLALTGCSTAGYGTDSSPKTSKYVLDKFDNGQFLAPFREGSPEIGISLEAMTHLSALGYDKKKQQAAIDWSINNTDRLTSPGLKATYIFTAHALGFASDPGVKPLLEELKKSISNEGVVKDTNNFSYSWVIFALLASDEKELANKVAMKLSTFSELNGGYKYQQGDPESMDTADVTGFSIMALKATEGLGTSEDEAAKTFAISKAKAWLKNAIVENNHWTSYNDLDVSGTAYAIMALTSLGEDVSDEVKWLNTRVNATDGGIIAPWTEPGSDVFSSAQALLALSKLSFIDVLKHKVN